MTLARRTFLELAAGVVTLLPAGARLSRAQSYPTRPVRLLVGAVAGSAPDVIARLIGQWLSERLGQPFVIENREGANGTLAAEAVVRSPPDGSVLLLVSASYTIDPSVFATPNLNFRRDIAPVAAAVRLPAVMTVNPSLPAKTIAEFIAYAKANPGQINIGAPGVGSPQYVAGELFMMMTDTKLAMIPYRGGPPAVTDAIGGQIQGMIGTVLLVIDHVRSGSLRALAVTSTTRSELLPEIPTVAEFVPGFDANQWIGIGAPTGTPLAVIDRLNVEINAALTDATVQARIAALGGMVLPGTAADFGIFIADETEKWAKVVKFSGAKAD
jgi:tripartite-type tricarboxylate transporter receptor subunit TctC